MPLVQRMLLRVCAEVTDSDKGELPRNPGQQLVRRHAAPPVRSERRGNDLGPARSAPMPDGGQHLGAAYALEPTGSAPAQKQAILQRATVGHGGLLKLALEVLRAARERLDVRNPAPRKPRRAPQRLQ